MSKQIGWLVAFILGVGLTAVFYPRSEYDKLNRQLNDLYEQREAMNLEITTLEARKLELEKKPVKTGHIVPEVEAKEDTRSEYDIKLMAMICEKGQLKGKVSPLCDNWNLYDSLAKISREKGVPFWLMVGVTYAESHIGVNFSKPECSQSNNRAGTKGFKMNDGKLDWGKMPNQTRGVDCWLYNFQSVEQFWVGLANTLAAYEKNCGRDPYCISVGYVGGKGVKNNRGYRVSLFNVE